MIHRSRTRRPLLAWTMLLTIPLAGCFGPSDDKGDNPTNKPFTPKPSTVEDANTAGERKTDLPIPPKGDAAPSEPADAKVDGPATKPAEAPPSEPK